MTKHHAYPQGRMKKRDAPKTDYPSLTIRLWRSRHETWHRVFRCLTIDEIIWKLRFKPRDFDTDDYRSLFKVKPIFASLILQRLKKIKTKEIMNQETALKVAHEVSHAIRDLDHLYVVVVIRENGDREVKVKIKGGRYVH